MSIRNRVIIFALIFALPLLILFSLQKKLLIVEGQTFGTHYLVKAYVPIWVTKQRLSHRLNNELKRLDLIFSTWNADSEISRFNRSKSDTPFQLSTDLETVFIEARNLYELSSGYYDPSIKALLDLWGFTSNLQYFKVPDSEALLSTYDYIGFDKVSLKNQQLSKSHDQVHLDFSSLAKGYGVDRVALLVEDLGSKRYMVEIGGEVRVRTTSKPWVLGISKPSYELSDQGLFKRIALSSGSIATSGDYRNYFQVGDNYYSHIFDPIKKMPIVNNIASVTVISESCMFADAMATAIMALGKGRGLAIVEALAGVECMIIYRDAEGLHPYYSSGFDAYIQ